MTKMEKVDPYHPFTYACRPPGAVHGPFRSERGCILLEIHYYDPALAKAGGSLKTFASLAA